MVLLCQRNPAWAGDRLGRSFLTVGRYGCTTCCVSMLSDYFGCYRTPLEIAHNVANYTEDGLVVWQALKFGSMRFDKRTRVRDDAEIRAALRDPDRAVMLEVDSSHWVVALRPRLLGNDYVVADPWFGDKCDLSKRYRKITGSAYFSRKYK